MSEQQEAPIFTIEKIYVKDLSLEVPNAPQIFLEREQPNIEVQLNSRANKVNDGIYEALVTVTVSAKLQDKTMFLVEATEAGIFQIKNVPDADLDVVLGIGCPNIIFPYLREVISDVVTRAGFPPMILAPVNFEALYAQQKAQQSPIEQPTTH
jgi:preprotein translocase subunit SecB